MHPVHYATIRTENHRVLGVYLGDEPSVIDYSANSCRVYAVEPVRRVEFTDGRAGYKRRCEVR
jgi:hypothetical protein